MLLLVEQPWSSDTVIGLRCAITGLVGFTTIFATFYEDLLFDKSVCYPPPSLVWYLEQINSIPQLAGMA
jgi:hypothetical protein